jgi:hypothetical protein
LRLQVKDELGYVTGIYLESDGAIAPGWHHLVIQIQGDTLAYWIDGVNVYTVSGSRVVCDHSGGELLLGHDPSAHAHGAMDDFLVYDRALGPVEFERMAGE